MDPDINKKPLSEAEAAAVWDDMEARGEDAVINDGLPAGSAPQGDDEDEDDQHEDDAPSAPAATPTPEKSATVAEPNELEALKKVIADLQARDVAREQETRRTAGRVAALQSALDKARAANEPPPKSPTQRLAKRPDKWQSVAEDYPDIASGAEELIDAVLGASGADASEELKTTVAAVLANTQDLANELQSTRDLLVEFKHPDWKSTVKSAEFVSWRQTQPQEVNALGASNDPRDAVRMLDLFQSWKGSQPNPTTVQRNRQSRLAGAASPAVGSQRIPEKPDAMKSAAEIWAEMDREEEARASRRR